MLKLSAFLYGKMIELRNALYDKGVLDTHDLGALTISIGNITAGGTGKTPLVAYVAEVLAARGEKVCVLTRGYGRKDANKRVLVSDGEQILAEPDVAGDEPVELAKKLLGKAIVIADADRVASAEWARRKFGVTTFVLDDGFQHRRAMRDVDILCIDATDPFGGGKMLPAGRLREPMHYISRADAIVITRANLAENVENLKSEISDLSPAAAIFIAENKINRVTDLEDFHTARPQQKDVESLRKAFAFCGIGNPDNFFDQLRQENTEVVSTCVFRDHHVYTASDVTNIERLAAASNADILLTTAKDAVKLSHLKFSTPCFVVEIEMVIDDESAFSEML